MTLDVARLRSLLDAHRDADRAADTAVEAARHAEGALVDAAVDSAAQLVEVAGLLRELLPAVSHGAVGHRVATDCPCALCRAVALVGLPETVPETKPVSDGAELLRLWMAKRGFHTPLELVKSDHVERVFPLHGQYLQPDVDRVAGWLAGAVIPDPGWRSKIEELTDGAVPSSSWEVR